MEFRGHCKVVDQPRANRALVRSLSNNNGAAPAPQHDLGVFGGPASNRVTGPPSGRRHSSEFARTGSKTSVFGAEASAVAPRPTGRKALTPRSTSPIAQTPTSDGGAAAAERPRTGRKTNSSIWKPDAVLTAENFRPLEKGEKPAVYCARGDAMSFRPHAANHGKAHLPSANRESILFPKDENSTNGNNNGNNGKTAAPTHADPLAMQRYDQRFTRSASEMARFKVTPDSARRLGMNEQDLNRRPGKHQNPAAVSARAQSLEGVLRPERNTRPVDRNYRVVPPWR